MTTQLSVIEVAELYGFNRQTVYKRINKGELSKNSDGKIDLAEAIRVFGEPASRNKSVTLETPENTVPSKEVDMLREQIDMLKEQLRLSMERERMAKEREDIAQDREAFYQNQIETMQRLLMAPKPPEEAPASAVQKDDPEGDYQTKSVAQDDESTVPVDKGIHEGTSAETPESKPSAEEKPKKGFWSSIFS